MSRKILITGACGFIGFQLAKRLSKNSNHELILVDNFDRAREDPAFGEFKRLKNVSFYDLDVSQQSALAQLPKVDSVYHFAALVGVQNVEANAEKVLQTNILSCFSLLDYAKTCPNLEKIFFASTSEVYAGTLENFEMPIPTPETTPITLMGLHEARTTYSLSKLVGESLFLMAGRFSGLPIVIGRYHNVYGPRMGYQHVIPQLIDRLRSEASVGVYSPTHSRAFCFIDDAISMTLELVEKSTGTEIYNIGNSREEVRIFDLAKMLKDYLKVDVSLFEGEITPGSPSRRCPDTTKAEALLGSLSFTSLADGLAKTAQWYLNNSTRYGS